MSAAGNEPGAARFVIVAARRTGSNLLCSLLDSHPAILCHHEIFNPAGIFYALDLRDTSFQLGTVADRDADPRAFVDRIWRRPEGRSCVGFKLTHGQAEAALESVLADTGVRKIVLRRRNRIKTCVSERVAERLDQWEVYDRAHLPAKRPAVEIDVEELREHVARNEGFYRCVESSLADTRQEFLRVCYEDLSHPEEQKRLLRFLDASPEDVRLDARSVKQNPRDMREIVENYDELAAALQGDPLHDELLDLDD